MRIGNGGLGRVLPQGSETSPSISNSFAWVTIIGGVVIKA